MRRNKHTVSKARVSYSFYSEALQRNFDIRLLKKVSNISKYIVVSPTSLQNSNNQVDIVAELEVFDSTTNVAVFENMVSPLRNSFRQELRLQLRSNKKRSSFSLPSTSKHTIYSDTQVACH